MYLPLCGPQWELELRQSSSVLVSLTRLMMRFVCCLFVCLFVFLRLCVFAFVYLFLFVCAFVFVCLLFCLFVNFLLVSLFLS